MSFSNLGSLAQLNEHEATTWWYNLGGDHGAQMAEADVKTPNAGAVHLADHQERKLENDQEATYFVTITNEGPGTAWHNLTGGGFA
jgi:hypothetical protein